MEDEDTIGDIAFCTDANKAFPPVPLRFQDLKLRVQHKLGDTIHID